MSGSESRGKCQGSNEFSLNVQSISSLSLSNFGFRLSIWRQKNCGLISLVAVMVENRKLAFFFAIYICILKKFAA